MSEPSLHSIQTLMVLGSYLDISGRERDAWTLFGTTVRAAYSVDLHRNPRILLPQPSLLESQRRQELWWWMLQMDQHYSTIFAKPLGVSGVCDCPAPTPTTRNQTELRLGEFVSKFTIIARQVLGVSDITNEVIVNGLTQRLSRTWSAMPEILQFDEDGKWNKKGAAEGDWRLEVTSASLSTTATPAACI